MLIELTKTVTSSCDHITRSTKRLFNPENVLYIRENDSGVIVQFASGIGESFDENYRDVIDMINKGGINK